MRTEEEAVNALRARIKQLEDSITALEKANGPHLSRAIMEAVKEELETYLGWVLNEEDAGRQKGVQ